MSDKKLTAEQFSFSVQTVDSRKAKNENSEVVSSGIPTPAVELSRLDALSVIGHSPFQPTDTRPRPTSDSENLPKLALVPTPSDVAHLPESATQSIVFLAPAPSIPNGADYELEAVAGSQSRPAKGYGSTRTTPKKFVERAARKLREQSNNRNFTQAERDNYALAAQTVQAAADGRPNPYQYALAIQQQGIERRPLPAPTRFEITAEKYFAEVDRRSSEPTELDGKPAARIFARILAYLNLAAIDYDQPQHRLEFRPYVDAAEIVARAWSGIPQRPIYQKRPDADPIIFVKPNSQETTTHANFQIAN